MADTASQNLGIRLQEQGVKLLWGTDLNEALEVIEEAVSGITTKALTGSVSLTSTNYVVNEVRDAILIFTDSSLSDVPTVTVPAKKKLWLVKNAGSTYNILISCGGVNATIRPGQTNWVYCDGTDVIAVDQALSDFQAAAADIAMGSNKITGLADGADANDAVNKSQLDAVVSDAGAAAAASAVAAATSATNAATSATNSATSATNSANSATASATSATAASTAQTNAETAETNAETAQTAAETAQAAAEAAAAGLGTEFADDVFRIQDNADATKELAFQVSGISTGTTRTITLPDSNGTVLLEETLNSYVNGRTDLGASLDATTDKLLVLDTSDSNTLKTINADDLPGGGLLNLLSTTTVSGSPAAVDFDITGSYAEYVFIIDGIAPATNGTDLLMQYSTDGGSTFLTSGYRWHERGVFDGSTESDHYGTTTPQLADYVSNNANYGAVWGRVKLLDPGNNVNTQYTRHSFELRGAGGAYGYECTAYGGGWNSTTTAVDAIRLKWSSGNFANKGVIRLYGVSR